MAKRNRKRRTGLAIGALIGAFLIGFASSYLANVAFFQWQALPQRATT